MSYLSFRLCIIFGIFLLVFEVWGSISLVFFCLVRLGFRENKGFFYGFMEMRYGMKDVNMKGKVEFGRWDGFFICSSRGELCENFFFLSVVGRFVKLRLLG